MQLSSKLLLTCMLIAVPVAGQEALPPIVTGESFALESRILNEARQIYVGMPQSYGEGTESYGGSLRARR